MARVDAMGLEIILHRNNNSVAKVLAWASGLRYSAVID
jgi:hypothetical protein